MENAMTDSPEKKAMQAQMKRRALHEESLEKKRIENSINITSNLLKCPDCGRDVSKRASACLNCGCPIEAIIADQDNVKEQKQDEKTNEKKPYNYVDNSPKCPHCGSKNYDKISLKNKIGAAALLGPFAIVHAGKTFKCKSCGFKW